MKYLIGVDEAGRGPLAGPVTVGVVAVAPDFDWELIPGVGDSKKISEKKRESIFERAAELKKEGLLNFAVGESSSEVIDREGIVGAIKAAMKQALEELAIAPEDCEVRLDGALHAPAIYTNQTTIIKGDATEPSIGLASIMAKVTRDRYMVAIATKEAFTPYNFAKHKGYGTKAHSDAIRQHGLCKLHRRSFCRSYLTHMSNDVSI